MDFNLPNWWSRLHSILEKSATLIALLADKTREIVSKNPSLFHEPSLMTVHTKNYLYISFSPKWVFEKKCRSLKYGGKNYIFFRIAFGAGVLIVAKLPRDRNHTSFLHVWWVGPKVKWFYTVVSFLD